MKIEEDDGGGPQPVLVYRLSGPFRFVIQSYNDNASGLLGDSPMYVRQNGFSAAHDTIF